MYIRKYLMQEVEKAEGDGEEEQEGFGGVLRRRQRAADASHSGDGADADPDSTQKLLDAYFGSDEAQLGEDDRFLKKFIASKASSWSLVHVPLCQQGSGGEPVGQYADVRMHQTLHCTAHPVCWISLW